MRDRIEYQPRPEEKPLTPQEAKPTGVARCAMALFRLGTRRARLAAAILVVVGSLVSQTGAYAQERARSSVLYLDAPSVSVSRAEQAGNIAQGYAAPDSTVKKDVLAWIGVDAPPEDVRQALASVTTPDDTPVAGITYETAEAAGETMVAQLGGDSPPAKNGSDGESASAEPVRPKLGSGEKTTEEAPREAAGNTEESIPDQEQGPSEYAVAESPAVSDVGPSSAVEDSPPAARTTGQPTAEKPATQEPATSEAVETGASNVPETAGSISGDYSPEPQPSTRDTTAGAALGQAEQRSSNEDSGVRQPDTREGKDPPAIVLDPGTQGGNEEKFLSETESSGGGPTGDGLSGESSPGPETSSNPEDTKPDNDGQLEATPAEPISQPSPTSGAVDDAPLPTGAPDPGAPETDAANPEVPAIVPYYPGTDEESTDQVSLQPTQKPALEDPPAQEPSTQELPAEEGPAEENPAATSSDASEQPTEVAGYDVPPDARRAPSPSRETPPQDEPGANPIARPGNESGPPSRDPVPDSSSSEGIRDGAENTVRGAESAGGEDIGTERFYVVVPVEKPDTPVGSGEEVADPEAPVQGAPDQALPQPPFEKRPSPALRPEQASEPTNSPGTSSRGDTSSSGRERDLVPASPQSEAPRRPEPQLPSMDSAASETTGAADDFQKGVPDAPPLPDASQREPSIPDENTSETAEEQRPARETDRTGEPSRRDDAAAAGEDIADATTPLPGNAGPVSKNYAREIVPGDSSNLPEEEAARPENTTEQDQRPPAEPQRAQEENPPDDKSFIVVAVAPPGVASENPSGPDRELAKRPETPARSPQASQSGAQPPEAEPAGESLSALPEDTADTRTPVPDRPAAGETRLQDVPESDTSEPEIGPISSNSNSYDEQAPQPEKLPAAETSSYSPENAADHPAPITSERRPPSGITRGLNKPSDNIAGLTPNGPSPDVPPAGDTVTERPAAAATSDVSTRSGTGDPQNSGTTADATDETIETPYADIPDADRARYVPGEPGAGRASGVAAREPDTEGGPPRKSSPDVSEPQSTIEAEEVGPGTESEASNSLDADTVADTIAGSGNGVPRETPAATPVPPAEASPPVSQNFQESLPTPTSEPRQYASPENRETATDRRGTTQPAQSAPAVQASSQSISQTGSDSARAYQSSQQDVIPGATRDEAMPATEDPVTEVPEQKASVMRVRTLDDKAYSRPGVDPQQDQPEQHVEQSTGPAIEDTLSNIGETSVRRADVPDTGGMTDVVAAGLPKADAQDKATASEPNSYDQAVVADGTPGGSGEETASPLEHQDESSSSTPGTRTSYEAESSTENPETAKDASLDSEEAVKSVAESSIESQAPEFSASADTGDRLPITSEGESADGTTDGTTEPPDAYEHPAEAQPTQPEAGSDSDSDTAGPVSSSPQSTPPSAAASEPVVQVPTHNLEPATQVSKQELEPATQVPNMLAPDPGEAASGRDASDELASGEPADEVAKAGDQKPQPSADNPLKSSVVGGDPQADVQDTGGRN